MFIKILNVNTGRYIRDISVMDGSDFLNVLTTYKHYVVVTSSRYK